MAGLDYAATFRWLLCLAIVKILHCFYQECRLTRSMPPGPPGLPVLGNVLAMPKTCLWLRLTEWSKKYGASFLVPSVTACSSSYMVGPIYSLNLAGQRAIVLSSFDVAADLLGELTCTYLKQYHYQIICRAEE